MSDVDCTELARIYTAYNVSQHYDFYGSSTVRVRYNENFIERALYSLFSPSLLLLFTPFHRFYDQSNQKGTK